MKHLKAYECELIGQEDLGKSYVFSLSRDKARYVTALSAHDAGYLRRPSPVAVRCRRAPDYDDALRNSKEDHPYSIDYINQSPSSPHYNR